MTKLLQGEKTMGKTIRINVEELTEKQAKEKLKELIEFLDEMDQEDCFGTEGWRYQFGEGN